jgi:WhiB family redox-sensing transcriptional regulator
MASPGISIDVNAQRAPRLGGLVPQRNGGVPDTEWMQRGLCRSTPLVNFFPTAGAGVAVARKVCAKCPVRAECLEYAIQEGVTHGVWGGASDRERQRIRATRGLKATAG